MGSKLREVVVVANHGLHVEDLIMSEFPKLIYSTKIIRVTVLPKPVDQ